MPGHPEHPTFMEALRVWIKVGPPGFGGLDSTPGIWVLTMVGLGAFAGLALHVFGPG